MVKPTEKYYKPSSVVLSEEFDTPLDALQLYESPSLPRNTFTSAENESFPIPVTLATSKFFIVTAPFGPVISIVSVRPPIAIQMTLKVLFLLLTAPILADMLKTVVKILRQLSRTQRPYLDNRFPQTQWICLDSCN